MHRTVVTIFVLLASSVPAIRGQGQEKLAPAPGEKYQTLLAESQAVVEAFSKGYAAKTYQERDRFLKEANRLRKQLVPRFLELAEKNPADAVALDALLWVVNNTQLAGKGSAGWQATALLRRDHIRSDRLGPVIFGRMAHALDRNYEAFLREVMESNPHEEMKGIACVSLGFFLKTRLETLDLLKAQPEYAGHYEALSNKEYLKELQRQNRAEIAKEAESHFEKAATQYGTVQIPKEGAVGERAKSELFELRHLAVGKKAPDIIGADQEGRQFKLSDYKGKVVLLDFWSPF